MTMDFGNGQNPLADAESAAKASVAQLETIFGVSSAQAWNMLGLTPIAGQNDDDENFTQPDATTLESFAASHGVQELAFWEVDQYDKPLGYAYSKTFNKITSSGGSGSSFPGGYHQLVAANSGLCVDVHDSSTSNSAVIDQWPCKSSGQANQEFQFNPVSGGYGELQNQNSGKDLVVQGASTANGRPRHPVHPERHHERSVAPGTAVRRDLAVQERQQRTVPGPGRRRDHRGRPVRPVDLQVGHRHQPGLRHAVNPRRADRPVPSER